MPWKKILLALGALIGVVGLGVLGFVIWLVHDLPSERRLAAYEPPITTRVHAGDGTLIGEFAEENRIFVPYDDIPEHVVNAFLSAEDKNFFEHGGLDLKGLSRAMITNVGRLVQGRRLHGASTITQQVAGNMLLNREYSYSRKIKEAVMAMRIEKTFSKQKILELYLNQIELGDRSFGVAAAALNYFNKPLAELTVPEAAMLAALPKGPTKWNPKRNPDIALVRRNFVLTRMAEDKRLYFINRDGQRVDLTLEKAKAEPLRTVNRFSGEEFTAVEYFTEEVRRIVTQKPSDFLPKELVDELKSGPRLRDASGRKLNAEQSVGEWLRTGGLSVRSTLDTRLQLAARRALREGLEDYDRRHAYRGPIGAVDGQTGWQAALRQVSAPADIGGWKKAAILSLNKNIAQIGMPDGSKGTLLTQDVDWANRTFQSTTAGRKKGLFVGDVVLVQPTEKKGIFALKQVPAVNGALIAMDPHSGRVLAMVGGYSFQQSSFNRSIQAKRQPGSTFKPFVYAAALERGSTPASLILDAPIVDCQVGAPCYAPQNYTKDFYGLATLRLGLEQSRNAMTVRLAQEIGLESVRDLAKNLGVVQDMPLYLSAALGSIETNLISVTTAYASFVNGGKKVEPTFIDRIQDRHGNTIYGRDKRPCANCKGEWIQGARAPQLLDDHKQVLDPIIAFQITYMLEGAVQRGSGRAVAVLKRPLAGKTGTTDDYRSAWFVGFSPDLVVGVFVGFDANQSLGDKETGGRAAAPIFRDFMAAALANQPATPFRTPPGVKFVAIDARTGQLPGPDSVDIISEAFRPGTEPTFNEAPSGLWNFGGVAGDEAQPSGVFGQTLTTTPAQPATRTEDLGGIY